MRCFIFPKIIFPWRGSNRFGDGVVDVMMMMMMMMIVMVVVISGGGGGGGGGGNDDDYNPDSILNKSTADRYPDGPITARYRFM